MSLLRSNYKHVVSLITPKEKHKQNIKINYTVTPYKAYLYVYPYVYAKNIKNQTTKTQPKK